MGCIVICIDCKAATLTLGHWRQFNALLCKYCAARLIQQIGRLRTPTSAAMTARRRVVLAGAIAHGHSEQEIRDLAKSKTMAVQPLELKKGKK
jgi:hypothetical protein